MANRKSRYDSISGQILTANVPNLAHLSILSQVLGPKFHVATWENGIATFEFVNR